MDIGFIRWIGHASFIFDYGGKNLYIDPFKLSKNFGEAELIFITHPHFDHLSIEDIKKIAGKNTKIVAPKEAADKLSGFNTILVEPNKKYSINSIDFETVRAYNVKKERLGFHPKSSNWVGYIINIQGKRIYHAGDTDSIEEMKQVRCDIALIPIGGTYTMDIEEAINATKIINSSYFVPMHYKALLGKEGSKKAEEKFSQEVKNSIIMEEIQEPSYSF
jgi:L-ascorbate metabolism protein UlaG (beta-lactamase superfamily)